MMSAPIATSAAGQAADPGEKIGTEWVLRALARPIPMRTNFAEVRDSPLLKSPMKITGEYQRPDEETVVRAVRSPYVETTTVKGNDAVIEREGKAGRKVSFKRAPEVISLHSTFRAILASDQTALEKMYAIETDGTRRKWKMSLTPKQAEISAKVKDMTLYGRGSELRCIETQMKRNKEVQRTLLASAAREAGNAAKSEEYKALCHGDAI